MTFVLCFVFLALKLLKGDSDQVMKISLSLHFMYVLMVHAYTVRRDSSIDKIYLKTSGSAGKMF